MARRFVRDWFTNELKEVEDDSPGGRQIIARIEPEYDPATTGRHKSAYDRGWVGRSISVPLNQMDAFNEASRRHNTGAVYLPRGDGMFADCHAPDQSSKKREFKLRGKIDLDGGYGDQTE